jgi:carbamate kinase
MNSEALRIVIALGGNALLRRGESPSADGQRRNVHAAARALAEIARAHSVVITHGNGPQVGLLALQAEAISDLPASSELPEMTPYPLDILGAQTQGMIGYLIEDELRDALGSDREVATLLTQVVVDARDRAFEAPSKPVGPVYDESTARQLAADRGWSVAADGPHWRRVVPSPEPTRILEIRSIELLLEAGVVVICAGGGGIPVVEDARGGWCGVEAVVDKDLSAALLARAIDADGLLLLTDVDAVYDDWGTDRATPIRRATPDALRTRTFAAGSMAPKVEAACRFVEVNDTRKRGGQRFACIGALEDTASLLAGSAGTRIAT